MSSTLSELAEDVSSPAGDTDARAPNGDVVRTPFYLTSCDESLQAWLHTGPQAHAVDHGVVICAPIGFEQLHAQRTLRHLADAVARQGIPTLRFDWHGTGDSAGSDADPSRCDTWLQNVRDAVAWMRRTAGCRRISVVGLRLGALLAVEALEPGECDNLVLWAPTTSGKSFVRQMAAVEQVAESRPRPAHAAAGDIEAGGFLLGEETAEQLKHLDLLKKPLNCLRILVVGPVDKRLVDRFATSDVPVTQLSPPGFAEMMAEPHFSRVPQEAVRDIAAWLGERIVVPEAGTATPKLDALGPVVASIIVRDGADPHASKGAARERLLQIGDVGLFGVWTEPAEPVGDLPAIILLNSGSASRVGPGRIYVELARRLASRGFRSLRLDADGLGDSVCRDPARENDPYPDTIFRDVQLAIGALRERFGVTRCVLLGLCSGAYAAFQSAAQIADPMLVESVLINPLTFHWEAGMPFDASESERLVKDHCRMARATNGRKLWRFLLGRTEIGYVEAIRLLGRRLRHCLERAPAVSSERSRFPPAVVGHPTENNLAADLARIAAAGRPLAMFLAENDPGQAVMAYHAPGETRRWLRSGALRVETIAGADHTFSRRLPRAALFNALTSYLDARYARGAVRG